MLGRYINDVRIGTVEATERTEKSSEGGVFEERGNQDIRHSAGLKSVHLRFASVVGVVARDIVRNALTSQVVSQRFEELITRFTAGEASRSAAAAASAFLASHELTPYGLLGA